MRKLKASLLSAPLRGNIRTLLIAPHLLGGAMRGSLAPPPPPGKTDRTMLRMRFDAS